MTANAPSKDCPGCHHIVSPNWRVCPFCGTRLHLTDGTQKKAESAHKSDEAPLYIGPEKDIGFDQVSTAWLLVILGALGLLAGTIILKAAGLDALFSTAGILSLALTVGGGTLVLVVGGILALASRGAARPGEDPMHARQRRTMATAAATVGGVLSGLAVAASVMLVGVVVGAILILASIAHLIQTCFEAIQPK